MPIDYIIAIASIYRATIEDGDAVSASASDYIIANATTTLFARLHRKTLCYSKSVEMLKHSIRLVIHYLKFWDVPVPYPSYDFNRPQTRQIG
jgi:hypothetical protein